MLCTLQHAVGLVEDCPGEPCPLWADGCVLAPVEHELVERPQLAQHLLELRAELERAARGSADEA